MAWTLVSFAARAGGAAGSRRTFLSPQTAERAARVAAAAADRPDVFARACAARASRFDLPARKALDAALDAMGQDAPVIERAVASGAPVGAVIALADAWPALSPTVRGRVRHPLGALAAGKVAWGDTPLTQVDQTTCGAASMVVMLLIGDPFVAAWMATGARTSLYLPAEAREAERALAAAGRLPSTIQDRWEALQRVVHARVTRHGLGPAPWPRRFGTPPWRIDNVTRLAGIRFGGVVVDDSRAADVAALTSHAKAALADGIPVPLYVSGDSSRGIDTVIPRHVVLMVAVERDLFHIYEPSSGAIHRWDPAAPRSRSAPAFGGWNRLAWAILPRWRA